MRKVIVILLSVGCLITLSMTVYYSYQVFQANAGVSFGNKGSTSDAHRIVYISQQLDSVFWREVKEGAELTVGRSDVNVEFWGSYRPNINELLKNMEIAIASKVSGIIVQGAESPDFVAMVNKASAKGIPVITIAIDAPESLRKTYVGSDHYLEGLMIGEQLAKKVNAGGKVALIAGKDPTSYQKLRQQGIAEALKGFPEVEIVSIYASRPGMLAKDETNEILNQYPDCKVFIGLNEEAGIGVVQSIRSRAKLDDYAIFSFEDSTETLELVKEGIIDSTLLHRPKDMGEQSMKLMLRWLEGTNLPLERNYYIPSKIVTEVDLQ